MAIFKRSTVRNTRKTRTQETSTFLRQCIRGVLVMCVVVLLSVGVWYITHLEAFTIRTITVEGGVTVRHDEIRAEIEETLRGNYAFLIPHRFSFLYPHDRMVIAVAGIPRVHNVEVDRVTQKEVKVIFDEHVPYALWCVHLASENCFFIDAHGYAFAASPQIAGGTFIRYAREGTEELKQGVVIPEDMLTRLSLFIERAQSELSLRIGEVFFKGNGDIELGCNGGGMVLISSTKDFATTFENLKSVLRSDAFKHLEPGNFQYVDARFENKIFVNEEMEAISTTTESLYATSTQRNH